MNTKNFAAALTFVAAALAQDTGKPWGIPLSHGGRLEMVWIKPGTFTMGSPESEPGRREDEKQFQVTLSHGYWLGSTEVTVAQWRDVMGTDLRGHLTEVIKDDTLYDFSGRKRTIRDFMNMSLEGDIGRYLGNEDDTLPMYFTSWTDAMTFCARLTERELAAGRLPAGYRYTLPTEAQWEYAARAGSAEATFGALDAIAWSGANSAQGYSGRKVGRAAAGPRLVAGKQANAWGLFDTAGNLWEWCADWYGPYPTGNATDPTGPTSGTARVNRGGSFGSGPGAERSANRASNPQAEASAYRGFRLALAMESPVL